MQSGFESPGSRIGETSYVWSGSGEVRFRIRDRSVHVRTPTCLDSGTNPRSDLQWFGGVAGLALDAKVRTSFGGLWSSSLKFRTTMRPFPPEALRDGVFRKATAKTNADSIRTDPKRDPDPIDRHTAGRRSSGRGNDRPRPVTVVVAAGPAGEPLLRRSRFPHRGSEFQGSNPITRILSGFLR